MIFIKEIVILLDIFIGILNCIRKYLKCIDVFLKICLYFICEYI